MEYLQLGLKGTFPPSVPKRAFWNIKVRPRETFSTHPHHQFLKTLKFLPHLGCRLSHWNAGGRGELRPRGAVPFTVFPFPLCFRLQLLPQCPPQSGDRGSSATAAAEDFWWTRGTNGSSAVVSHCDFQGHFFLEHTHNSPDGFATLAYHFFHKRQ